MSSLIPASHMKQFKEDRRWILLASFLLGLSNFIYFKSFGVIILLEAFAVIMLLARLLFNFGSPSQLNYLKDRNSKSLYILGIIWLLGQCISDILNESESLSSLKLISQIIVLLILMFWGLTWFQRSELRLFWFTLGYSISSIPNYFLTPNNYIIAEPWKFCFGPAVTILLLLWFSKSQIRLLMQLPALIPLLYFDILIGSRALALVTILSWTSCFLNLGSYVKKTRLFLSVLSLALVAVLTSNVYHNLALSGNLGLNQQTKALQQFGSGPLILVARSELLFEVSKIRHNFLIGSGSNPNLTTDILNDVYKLNTRIGVDSQNTAAFIFAQKTGKVPQHSLLFSFWMFGGVSAAAFWLYLFYALSKWTIRNRIEDSSYFYLSRFLYMSFVWNFFFSPLGAGQRVLLALTIAIIFHDRSTRLINR